MNPNELLKEIITKYGPDICLNRDKCKGIISDYFKNSYNREKNLLYLVLDEKIVEELIINPDNLEINAHRYINNLVQERGVQLSLAQWAICTWAYALNIHKNFRLDTDNYMDISCTGYNFPIEKIDSDSSLNVKLLENLQYHYALADDIISWDDFCLLVKKKISCTGNRINEIEAADQVIEELGRRHVKIRELSGSASLFMFYAKIIDIPKLKITTIGGRKSLKGKLIVADATGHISLIFIDEQAISLTKTFVIGDVIEIIGEKGEKQGEFLPLNLRKSNVKL